MADKPYWGELMPVTVVVGLQWGDEGKGRVVDLLAEKADVVARFNAGPNAGHTVVNQGRKFVLHLIPAGIFHPHTMCLIANGTVVDPFVLANELAELEEAGTRLQGRLCISPRCHLIMPFHRLLDRLNEETKGAGRTGTTGRGIGPVYADKVAYLGIRVGDLFRPALLRQRLEVAVNIKNRVLAGFGAQEMNIENLLRDLASVADRLAPYVQETYPIIQEAIAAGRNVLMAGANGTLLDNDFGTYPFCTASTTIAAGVGHGAGIAPRHIEHVVGVLKAYTTRVGAGPFPTELADETGEHLRRAGSEFGATTGRPRRCGWFDGPLARYAAELNGCDSLALTKLDVLDGLPVLRIATSYRLHGRPVHSFPVDAYDLDRVDVDYEEMPGWLTSTAGVRRFSDLPPQARRYVERLEGLANVPIGLVAVGPEREAVILRS